MPRLKKPVSSTGQIVDEVAAAAGVNRQTVIKLLVLPDDVTPAHAIKVLETFHRLGYGITLATISRFGEVPPDPKADASIVSAAHE